MPTDNSLLFRQQQSRIPNKVGFIGDLKYAPRDMHATYIGNGWNTAKPSSQLTRVVFPNPGTLAAGQVSYLLLTKPSGEEVVITLRNDTAGAIPADAVLLAAVNGGGGLNTPSNNVLYGYTATVPVANTVEIAGPPGAKFELSASVFPGATAPTITVPTAATVATRIKYGTAVVRNPVLFSQAINGGYPNNVNGSIIASDWDKIVAPPSAADGEIFAGFAIRSINDVQPTQDNGSNSPGYFDAGDCVHYLNNTDHNQHILVQLEVGAIAGATPIGAAIYYRNAAVAGQTLGALSASAGAGLVAATAPGTADYWVIKEVVDLARRLYYIGLISEA